MDIVQGSMHLHAKAENPEVLSKYSTQLPCAVACLSNCKKRIRQPKNSLSRNRAQLYQIMVIGTVTCFGGIHVAQICGLDHGLQKQPLFVRCRVNCEIGMHKELDSFTP